MELKLIGPEVLEYFGKDRIIESLREQVAELEGYSLAYQSQITDYEHALNDIAANVTVYPTLREVSLSGLKPEVVEMLIKLKENQNETASM